MKKDVNKNFNSYIKNDYSIMCNLIHNNVTSTLTALGLSVNKRGGDE